jgi:hypothetical protein
MERESGNVEAWKSRHAKHWRKATRCASPEFCRTDQITASGGNDGVRLLL